MAAASPLYWGDAAMLEPSGPGGFLPFSLQFELTDRWQHTPHFVCACLFGHFGSGHSVPNIWGHVRVCPSSAPTFYCRQVPQIQLKGS